MNNMIENWTLVVVVFLFPILFVPFPLFSESYLMPKTLLLLLGIILISLVKISRLLTGKKLSLKFSRTFVLLSIFAAIYTLSAIIITPNKMEAFFFPGSVTLVIISLLYYQFISNSSEKTKSKIVYALIFSGLIVSIFSIVSNLKLIPNLPPGLLGGVLPDTIFLATLMPLAIYKFIKSKKTDQKIIFMICSFFIIMAVTISIYNLLPNRDTSLKLPNISTSWSISVDSLKNNPFLGVGPGNYLSSFNKFVPLTYNSTDLFSIRFPMGASFFLTTLAESGVLGFLSFVLVIFFAILESLKKINGKSISLILMTILLALFPANHLFWLLFVVFLALLKQRGVEKEIRKDFKWITILISTIALVLTSIFFLRAYIADYSYTVALKALSENDAQKTYDSMKKAVTLSPNVDRYRITFAQINYALAESRANSLKESETEETKEEGRNAISLFLGQSIEQAKAGVALNPDRSSNWEVLGKIYQSMIQLAEGADQFAIQTFSQAISLDPINPSPRIALGGILYSLGEYDQAIEVFKLAVLTKPDLANSHYNLAVAYRENGDIDKAGREFNLTLSLLEEGSEEHNLVKNEIKKLTSNAPVINETEGEIQEITPPQGPLEPIIDPKVELP